MPFFCDSLYNRTGKDTNRQHKKRTAGDEKCSGETGRNKGKGIRGESRYGEEKIKPERNRFYFGQTDRRTLLLLNLIHAVLVHIVEDPFPVLLFFFLNMIQSVS